MSVTAWVIISVLVMIVVVLVIIAGFAMNLTGELLSGLIQSMGGPNITKKDKKRC